MYTLNGYEVAAGKSPVDILYAATYAAHGARDVEQIVVTGSTPVITGLVPSGSVGTTIYGTTTQWWEATSAGTAGANLGPQAMVGGCPSSTSSLCTGQTTDFYAGSNIDVLTRDNGADSLLIAGRSGLWYYNPSESPQWQPAVNGLVSTFELDAAVDPANSANVAVTDADWNVLASTDGMADVDSSVAPPFFTANHGTGYALAWDADPSLTPGRGWIVTDPNTPTAVWIANTNGLSYVDTATCTTTPCMPTVVVPGPGGPVAAYASATGDYVYMAGGSASPMFWEVQVTQCAVACPTATGFVDPYYHEAAGQAISLTAGSDGTVYLATQGNGMLVATAP